VKNFPNPIQKILPEVIILSTASAEANITGIPWSLPRATVLRVRLSSRPGDRFSGVLDS